MYADNEYPSAVFDLFRAGKVAYLSALPSKRSCEIYRAYISLSHIKHKCII